jgi:DNA-directed RNA polymerase specialized sigma24 family protein
MTSLTADERMLLRGTFDDSLSVQDVADTLGVERQTVRNRVNALVANWVELLEDPTPDEAGMFLQFLKEAVLNPAAGGHDDA